MNTRLSPVGSVGFAACSTCGTQVDYAVLVYHQSVCDGTAGRVWPPSAPDSTPLRPDAQGFMSTPDELADREAPAEVWCSQCEQPSSIVADGEVVCDRHGDELVIESAQSMDSDMTPAWQQVVDQLDDDLDSHAGAGENAETSRG